MIDTEPFLEAAIASLRANLPTRIAAINAERNPDGLNGFDLDLPDDRDYYLGVVKKPIRYPIVEIAVPDWTMTDFDLSQLTANADFPMMVSVTVRDVGEAALHSDRLYRRQVRYVRALLNVLLVPDAFGQHATVASCRGAYRQNPEERQSEEVIGAALVAFGIKTTDSREP